MRIRYQLTLKVSFITVFSVVLETDTDRVKRPLDVMDKTRHVKLAHTEEEIIEHFAHYVHDLEQSINSSGFFRAHIERLS